MSVKRIFIALPQEMLLILEDGVLGFDLK